MLWMGMVEEDLMERQECRDQKKINNLKKKIYAGENKCFSTKKATLHGPVDEKRLTAAIRNSMEVKEEQKKE